VLSLEHELERLQRSGSNRNRERELEEKLEERERELRELWRRKSGFDDDDAVVVVALREAEARNADLEDELENARGLLEENVDGIERLRELVERRGGGDQSANESMGPEGWRERLKRRVGELEADNQELLARLEHNAELIARREEEKEDLADDVDALRLELEDMQRRREAESIERSESRAQILEEREREAAEDDLNAVRDKLAALMIEMQQKEDELDMKNKEIEELVTEHQRIVEVVEDERRGEVEEARSQVEELRDVREKVFIFIFPYWSMMFFFCFLQVLAEREAESKDFRVNISELEANTNDLHNKFESALAHLEQESDQKDAELESLQETIDKLGEQIYQLEDENDRLKEEHERMREEEVAERERLEALSAALKEVSCLSSLSSGEL